MSLRKHSGKLVGLSVATAALSLSFGGWALATHSVSTPHTGSSQTAPTPPPGGTLYGDDFYKVENGVVYEWDDGRWKAERDKKIENGVVYDFDDGRWKIEYDPSTYNAKPQNNNGTQQTGPTQQNQTQVAPQPAPKPQAQNNTRPNSKYKVENGVVYEWDDGRWEPEYDKKSDNGAIYEYDDGRWEQDYDDWDDDDDYWDD